MNLGSYASTKRPLLCYQGVAQPRLPSQLRDTLDAQVARKFVPMVCCEGLLAIMDQHAADERVCLERLRAEVRCLPAPS